MRSDRELQVVCTLLAVILLLAAPGCGVMRDSIRHVSIDGGAPPAFAALTPDL
jgi:hypothetical protein